MDNKYFATESISQAPRPDAVESRDGAIMAQMGKKQQLRRNFGFLSILALSSTLLASWETMCRFGQWWARVFGLWHDTLNPRKSGVGLLTGRNGINYPNCWQYHWTAQFSPPRFSAFMSYMQGCITMFAWQALVTAVTFLTATQIQGLLVLNYESYVFARWHGTLLMWAFIAVTFFVNVFGITLLPWIELIGGLCHIAFFIILLVPLVVLSPRSSADFVFTQLIDAAGWNNSGIAWCVGLLTVTYCFTGLDGAVHMSEEVRESATTVPKILIYTVLINGTMALGFLLVLLFCIGNLDAVLNTKTGYPIIEIFYQATGSTSAATAMMSTILIIAFASTFGILASVSRLTWAFARDQGLPFSNFFSYVNPHYRIPIRAIGLVTFVVVMLSFINIGSSTALNAILSLSTLALYISYIIPITLLVIKRLRGHHIVFGPFHLGKLGLPINLFCLVFLLFVSIFLPFPPQRPVTGTNMNYASPVFGGVLAFAIGMWFFGGSKQRYAGPRREVNEHELQGEGIRRAL